MKPNKDFPINEDWYIGENPENFPKPNKSEPYINKNIYKQLPEKYIKLLPTFIAKNVKFYIGPGGDIKSSEIFLTEKFMSDFIKYFRLNHVPDPNTVTFLLEQELEKVFKFVK